MNFIDSHCHLILDAYNADRENIIQQAFSNNITHIVQSCDNLEEIEKNLLLAKDYENMYSSVGIHPHEANKWKNECKDIIINYSKHEKVIAIGETGLDFYYNYSSKEAQTHAFKEQIKIAKEVSLPLIIHCRDAFYEALDILRSEGPGLQGVFHCYTGNLENAKEAIKLGFYISWSGILTFRGANDLRTIAKEISLEKILIETDCPYLTPAPYRGKCNEPKYVRFVAEELARIHNVSIDEVGKITTENTKKLFKIK